MNGWMIEIKNGKMEGGRDGRVEGGGRVRGRER